MENLKKKQSILFYGEEVKMLEDLQAHFQKSSLGEVSTNQVVRKAIRVLNDLVNEQKALEQQYK